MSAVEPQVPVETPAPAAPAPAPAPAAPAKPETLHDTVARAVEKTNSQRGNHAQYQPRKEQGQFAGPPQFPTPPPSSAPATPPAVPQRPEMPKSLKQELKSHWDAAPLELVSDFVRRDGDYEKGIRELAPVKAQLEEILNEFKPYEMLLKAENATPRQAIAPLLQTAAILRTGSAVQKAQAVASTMRQFGISLEHVQQMLAGGLPQQTLPQSGNALPQQALDPQFQQLDLQVQQLLQRQQQQEDARAMAMISEFAAKPEHKHFEAVSPHVLRLLLAMKEDPSMQGKSEQEKLSVAYETAIYADPEIRKQILAEQQAAERQAAEQATAQARTRAVQISGSPRAAPAPEINPTDMQAVVANAIRRNQR